MELTWTQFLLRTIPETFIMIWGMYVISREKINFKRHIILTIINSLAIFLIRKLPIVFGVHIIINIFALIATSIIFGIPTIKAIYSTLFVFILLIIGEILNLVLLNHMNIDINSKDIEPFMDMVYKLPSLIILALGITIIYYIFKKGELKMYLSEKIAFKLGEKSRNVLNLNEQKEQIIVYGAINLLQILFSIFWVIIGGLIFGVLYEAIVFSLVVAILRKYSGGVHASTPAGCVFIGAVISTLTGLMVNKILFSISTNKIILFSILCIIISFIIIYKKAPVDSIKKTITNLNIKRKLRINSMLTIIVFSVLIIILFILNYTNYNSLYINTIECIALGILWQSLSLTKIGFILFKIIDLILNLIMKGGEIHEEQSS